MQLCKQACSHFAVALDDTRGQLPWAALLKTGAWQKRLSQWVEQKVQEAAVRSGGGRGAGASSSRASESLSSIGASAGSAATDLAMAKTLKALPLPLDRMYN